jgi:hypothetical protein
MLSLEISEKTKLRRGEENDEKISYEEEVKERTKNERNRSLVNFFLLFPTIIGSIAYVLSLEGCYESQFQCLNKFKYADVVRYLIEIVVASIFYFVQIILYYYQYTGIYHLFIEVIVLYLLCFVYDTGANLESHGALNRIFLLGILILILSTFFLASKIISFFKRRPFLILLIIIISSLILYSRYISLMASSCEGWNQGLGNSIIKNEGYYNSCILNPPQTCGFRISDGIFDMNKILSVTCQNQKSYIFDNIEPFLKNKTTRIVGYPRTEYWQSNTTCLPKNFQTNVLNNLIDMEDASIPQEIKSIIEVTTNFTNIDHPEVKINIKKNETLSETRREQFKKSSTLTKNVLFLFIDSISRSSFKLKLPKTWSWLNKYFQEYIYYLNSLL